MYTQGTTDPRTHRRQAFTLKYCKKSWCGVNLAGKLIFYIQRLYGICLMVNILKSHGM